MNEWIVNGICLGMLLLMPIAHGVALASLCEDEEASAARAIAIREHEGTIDG